MKKQGPIVIIEDDKDDHYLIREAVKNLRFKNELVFLSDGFEALDYLRQKDVHPFLVISDLNMPKMSGLQLREIIFQDKALAEKCAPYLFFTNDASIQGIREAYGLSVQGFFTKPTSFALLEEMLRAIITYWQLCASPL